MASQEQLEEHPWKWFVPPNAKNLILGTFPTQKINWSFDFFYPNCANSFWKVLSKVHGTELRFMSGQEAIDERQKILSNLLTGVSDMGYKITRKEKSSVDGKLKLQEAMNIIEILETNKTINHIILTSSTGPVNALKWFKIFLKEKKIGLELKKERLPYSGTLSYNRETKVSVVASTSPLAAIGIEELVRQYKSVL